MKRWSMGWVRCVGAGLVALGTVAAHAQPQAAGAVEFPRYPIDEVVQGLATSQRPRAAAFQAEAARLTAALQSQCGKPGTDNVLRQQWLQSLLAWQGVATPAIGPVLARRSQRAIDFWPTRPNLIEKALARAPAALADLEPIGTPAKGFPALEWLLRRPPTPQTCGYAVLLAQEIEAEAAAVLATWQGVPAISAAPAAPVAPASTAAADAAQPSAQVQFVEWVNQWLAGWERLRWAQIEQPIQKGRTQGSAPDFARQGGAVNLADWRAQWAALKAQARLAAPAAPQAAQGAIPIEALLLGKGERALAAQWAQALDKVDARMAALQAQPGGVGLDLRALSSLAQDMKAVTVLFQHEVSAALEVPLGFSDADGD